MKKGFITVLIIFALFLSTACDKPDSKGGENNNIKDRAGYDIVIPDKIEKIASIGGSNTRILVDLGLADKIVCADTYSDVTELKDDILCVDMFELDIEQIADLNPDLIISTTMIFAGGQSDPLKTLKDLGICVAYIETSETIEDIKKDIKFIADITDVSSKGEQLIAEMNSELNKISEIGSKIPDSDKKTVYFENSPLYSFGSGVFLNEMIELIGAVNILKDETSWIPVAGEVVVNSNPDVILTSDNFSPDPVNEIKTRQGWDSITAVINDEVYLIDADSSSQPTHNIIKALKEMLKAVYPDLSE